MSQNAYKSITGTEHRSELNGLTNEVANKEEVRISSPSGLQPRNGHGGNCPQTVFLPFTLFAINVLQIQNFTSGACIQTKKK